VRDESETRRASEGWAEARVAKDKLRKALPRDLGFSDWPALFLLPREPECEKSVLYMLHLLQEGKSPETQLATDF